MRLGINKPWSASWFSKKRYVDHVVEDMKIRSVLKRKLKRSGLCRVTIERTQKEPRITLYVSRPGAVIGKSGAGIESLAQEIKKAVGIRCSLNISEVRDVALHANLVASDIAQQMEKRVSYKKAMKRAMQNTMRAGAKGIRVNCAGRLGGVEIARTEWQMDGRLPLHSLRSDIDFASETSQTISGACGVKVWIYRGDILSSQQEAARVQKTTAPART
jgi:small subunit ribosomal protein S3